MISQGLPDDWSIIFFDKDSSNEMAKTLRYFTDVFGYFAREKNALLRDVLLVHT